MTKETISAQIKENVLAKGWQLDDLRVIPDPYSRCQLRPLTALY